MEKLRVNVIPEPKGLALKHMTEDSQMLQAKRCDGCGKMRPLNAVSCLCGAIGYHLVPAHPKTIVEPITYLPEDEDYEPTALDKQVGGSHYKSMAIQPTEFSQRNKLNFCEANIVKYACRHQAKGGRKDVQKIIHYAELLLELEYDNEND